MSTLRAIKSLLVVGSLFMTAIFSIACSARGDPATASNQTKAIPMGTTFFMTRSASSVYSVAWSPDGQHIASGGTDDTVQVWNATTGKRTLTYYGHTNGIQALAWSPDGSRLASGSWDTTVQIWNATTGRHIFTYRGHADIIGSLAWSPDGRRIASTDDQLRVWQAG